VPLSLLHLQLAAWSGNKKKWNTHLILHNLNRTLDVRVERGLSPAVLRLESDKSSLEIAFKVHNGGVDEQVALSSGGIGQGHVYVFIQRFDVFRETPQRLVDVGSGFDGFAAGGDTALYGLGRRFDRVDTVGQALDTYFDCSGHCQELMCTVLISGELLQNRRLQHRFWRGVLACVQFYCAITKVLRGCACSKIHPAKKVTETQRGWVRIACCEVQIGARNAPRKRGKVPPTPTVKNRARKEGKNGNALAM
jgi:hypothetical protein